MNAEKSAQVYYTRYFLPLASDAVLYLLATCSGEYALNKREIALRCKSDDMEYYSRQHVYHNLQDLQEHIRNPPGKRLLCIEFGAIFPGLHIDEQPFIPPKPWPCNNNEWEVKPRQFERKFAGADGNASGWGEMVIDVDMEYDRTNICGCGKEKRVCDTCWDTFMWPAHRALEWAVKRFFGYKRVFTVFSGRRGFHMWICDPRVIQMTHLERTALVAILSKPSSFVDDFTDGMYAILAEHFDQNPLLVSRCKDSKEHRNVVFETLWPRLDIPVSCDALQHLHKIPLVLHAETNVICIVMGSPNSKKGRFKPSEDTYAAHHIGPELMRDIVSGCAHRIIQILKE